MTQLFIVLVTIVIVSRLAGMVFAKMNQPPVMGEVIGGILLGPSFLGKFFPTIALALV